LFAGCGGSSLGYSMAGFHELLAVEWNDNAVETFKLNFPDVPVFHGDIAGCSVDWILETTGLKPGELDILDGSPPCQGFSTAGKRILADDRNQLFREFVRILRGLQPKVFVMENVSGMVKGKMKLVFAEIMRELKDSGYRVSSRLMNTKWFGVPQSRERVIFIGNGSHPEATCQTISIGKATEGCNEVEKAPPFRQFNIDLWNSQKIGQNGNGKSYYNHVKVNPKKPLPTIPKSCVFGGFSGLSHWYSPKSLNLGQLMRGGGFPDNFVFVGNYEDAVNRIGNSVPPVFMMHIAEHLKAEMTGQEPVLVR